MPPRVVRFAVFEVDLTAGEILKHGVRLRLQDQPFQVLAALLEKPGEVVTREELIARLWPDGVNVDFDRGINAAVARLRQVLSDSAESPRYVETVARRGYRFLAALEDAAPVTRQNAQTAPSVPRSSWLRRWPVAVGLIAVAGLVSWLLAGWPKRSSEGSVAISPLTTERGYERNPSFSPDGSQFAFEWDQGRGQPRIFIKVTGAGDPVRLTSAEAPEFGPAWSRDGRFVAFLRAPSQAPDNVSELSLFVIPAVGGVERKLGSFSVSYWNLRNPLRRLDWAPDGRHIIVSAADSPVAPSRLCVINVDNASRKWLTDIKGSDLQEAREPAISPDGRSLAFTSGQLTVDESLYVLPVSADLRPAGEARRLTSGKIARGPAWTPDGREILFSFDGRLSRIRTAGSATPREIPGIGNGHAPAFSTNGRLAFERRDLDTNVWRIDLRGGASATRAIINSTARDQDAKYSPDGTRIAFQSTRSGWPEIWTCDSEGSHCVRITDFKNRLTTGTPRWSPDGRRIAFDSASEGKFHIYVADSNGGSVRRMTNDPGNQTIPSWSQDGRWIYFAADATGRNEICKVPAAGGPVVRITHGGGTTAFEDRGNHLYYTRQDADPRLYRSNLDGTGESEILTGVAARAFALSGGRVYYIRAESDELYTVRRFTIATREDEQLATIGKRPYLGLSVSPDQRYLLYSQVDQEGSDLMLASDFR